MPTLTLKPPPKFVTNDRAWAYTLYKLAVKDQLDEAGNPRNYGAACAIYKRVEAKYGGEPPALTAVEDAQFLTRQEAQECAMSAWFVSRGIAWAVDDAATVRLWQDHGWHVERDGAYGLTLTGRIDQDTAEWLVGGSPQALAWAQDFRPN